MGYTFDCDRCGEPGKMPALVCEFREDWFKTSELGGQLATAHYEPSDMVTFCGACTLTILTESDA